VSEANNRHDDHTDGSAEILRQLSDLDEESNQRPRLVQARLRHLASHRDFAILLVAVTLFIFFAVFGRHFLTEHTMVDIARRAAILGILAVGMAFLFVSGELDLSIGSHYGFLLILISYQNERLGIDPALASLVAIGIGMAIGAINGFFVTRIGLPSFIMTLGMLALLRGAANAVSSGYPIPAKNTDLPFYQIIRQSFFGTPVPNMFVAMLVVAAIGAAILALTKFGSDAYATGGNVVAAQNSGINTKRVKFRCFVAMGGLCGVAAALLFGRIGLAPLSAGINLELQVIAAIIVGGVGLYGGRGTIFGSLIGVLITCMITSGLILMGVKQYWDGVATGAVILIAVGMNLLVHRGATGRLAEA
jgi:ribose/xylose/arabinose/galactoside ABC-type transport system permease subunit